MKLFGMTVDNFLGIKHGELSFDKPGLVLIEGENNDSPSSISNGAGKSSIFEAVLWVFTGKTKRGLTGDSVINILTKRNCQVSMTWDNYTVIRSRKHDENGTGLRLFEHTAGLPSIELTRSTNKDTQAILDSLIKIPPSVLEKIAYFGQEDVKSFASLTDSELKGVFSDMLGMDFLSASQKKVKVYYEEREKEEADCLKKIDSIRAKMDAGLDQLVIMKKARKEWEGKVKAEIKKTEANLNKDDLKLQASTKEHEAGKEELIKAKQDVVRVQQELAVVNEAHRKSKDARGAVSKVLMALQTKCDYLARDLQRQVGSLKSISDKIGSSCGECGKVYEENDLAGAMSQQKASIGKGVVALKKITAERDDYIAKEDALKKQELLAKTKVTELQEKNEHIDKGLRLEWKIDALGAEITQLKASVIKQKKTLEGLVAEFENGNRWATDITKQKTKLSKLTDKLKEKEMALEQCQEEGELAKALAGLLGNGGLKSYIFDSVTPELNRVINDYMQELDDIEVEISTVSRLKNGDYREKFAINIKNRHGAENYKGQSGGEKQKVNLAIALGFNKIARTLSSESINCLFLDEPFESLDSGSSDKVVDLCRSFTDSENTFIITHNQDIKDLIPERVVVKKNGGSAIF